MPPACLRVCLCFTALLYAGCAPSLAELNAEFAKARHRAMSQPGFDLMVAALADAAATYDLIRRTAIEDMGGQTGEIGARVARGREAMRKALSDSDWACLGLPTFGERGSEDRNVQTSFVHSGLAVEVRGEIFPSHRSDGRPNPPYLYPPEWTFSTGRELWIVNIKCEFTKMTITMNSKFEALLRGDRIDVEQIAASVKRNP